MYYAHYAGNNGYFSFRAKDPGSALTHLIGVIYSILLTPVMLIRASMDGQPLHVLVGCSVFMLSMVLLYSASTVYHSFDLSPKANKRLRKIDHLMIFVLIAGSYTPICLTTLKGGIGIPLLCVVWGVAFVGMVFKLCWVTCPKWVSSVIYIAMGWACVAAFPELWSELPRAGFCWLLIGGLIYTAGGVLYALKLKRLNALHPHFGSHEIFHVFVMLGNLCQFWCIFRYCV